MVLKKIIGMILTKILPYQPTSPLPKIKNCVQPMSLMHAAMEILQVVSPEDNSVEDWGAV